MSLTTSEGSARALQAIQDGCTSRESTAGESQRRFAVLDDTPLRDLQPVRARADYAHMSYMTEKGRNSLSLEDQDLLAVLNPDDEGGIADAVGSPDLDVNADIPYEHVHSDKVLCEKTASH